MIVLYLFKIRYFCLNAFNGENHQWKESIQKYLIYTNPNIQFEKFVYKFEAFQYACCDK